MKKLMWSILFLLLVLIGILLFNTLMLKSKQIKVPASEVVSVQIDDSAAMRLGKSIQIKTVSYDEPEKVDAAAFDSLHELLRVSFPLVHQNLSRTVVNKHSLLYTWKGKNNTAKPIIMYAHMDVVPVEDINLADWEVPPFSGEIKDGYVWGRGALDDKGSVLAILEAAEKLLKVGFVPERDVYFAFGHDEEIGGEQGAKKIAELLLQKKVHAEFYVDEGGLVSHGMVPGVNEDFALIGTGEKGFLTLELSVKMESGHSSRPPRQTALGTLITALAKLEEHTFERTVSITVNNFIDFVGPELKMPLKMVFANKWIFKGLIMDEYQKSIEGNAMIRTTGVPTVLHAGVKENIVPGEASAKVNFRVLQGETSQDVIKKVKAIIDNDTVKIKPFGITFEPSKNASTDAPGFLLLQRSIAKVFPDAKVAPFLMIGSTDSKHFEQVADNLYRFLPVRMGKEEVAKIHGVNERISVKAHAECIAFYETFLRDLK
ncbi:MAG: M20 family peptidase [Chitinophagales bacterium]|nr:M20 family peptidase [Chitinophagales bacterium]